jgi:hypothetical protein
LGRFESTRTSAEEARAELDARGRREASRNIARADRVVGGALTQEALPRSVPETAQTAAQGKQPSWRTLLARWNETYPEGHEWHYGNGKDPDRRVWYFRRDYGRAEKAVLRPDHHFPKRKAKTELEGWSQQDLNKRRIAAERYIDDVIETLEEATDQSPD